MGQRWQIFPHDPARIAALERIAGVSSVVAQLLLSRGISDPAAARAFLDPRLTGLRNPAELPGASEAARRLFDAARSRRRIIVYGDYDADGMTGAAILVRCLRLVGGDVGYYVPNRLEEGYGLSDEALQKLAGDGARTVVSVDCGIASVDQAQTARRLGLELIVTDHHQIADRLPEADVLVHPALPGTNYPFAGLCGAGVALKLAWAICQQAAGAERVPERMRNFLLQAVGLAALGTVADVVPLVDENRVLVRDGLKRLVQFPPLGLAKLMQVTSLDQKRALTSEDLAFTLAPRLNAAGRLGQAQLGVELLVTDSSDRATALAEYIHELNGSRDSLERSVYLAAHKQAKEQFDPAGDAALVLAGHGWHLGVIGIVAGRLAEKYHRPVVLISLDELDVKDGIGSARSVRGFDLYGALAGCSEHLLSYGGHTFAAGLKICPRRIDLFREDFCQWAAEHSAEVSDQPELHVDAEVPLAALSLETVAQMERLAPFGRDNPRPVLCTSCVQLSEPPKPLGTGGRHLALRLDHHGVRLRALAFGKAEWAESLERQHTTGPLRIAYRPVINEFRGRRSVELHLVDWHADDAQIARTA